MFLLRPLVVVVALTALLALPVHADMIGVNFVGRGTVYSQPLDATESAGAPGFTQVNWNNAEGSSNSTGQSLHDENNQATGATLTWTYAAKSNTYISDTPGDRRMMRGYISQHSLAPTVTVSGLGSAFTSPGYDVLVYFDGENSTDWTTNYTISVGVADIATISGKDLADANFSGTFDDATTDGTGNYLRFTGLTSSAFTLTATPVTGSAPINAIQIVAIPEPGTIGLTLLAAGLALWRRRAANRPQRRVNPMF